MSQNLVSLQFSEAVMAAVDGALDTLDQNLDQLIELSTEERRALNKMGDKSEAFCRQALVELAENRDLIPPSLDLDEARRDLANIDLLRPRIARLGALLAKCEDTHTALGSDVLSAALEGYAFLKVAGKGSSLEVLRKAMSARFARRPKKPGDVPS